MIVIKLKAINSCVRIKDPITRGPHKVLSYYIRVYEVFEWADLNGGDLDFKFYEH